MKQSDPEHCVSQTYADAFLKHNNLRQPDQITKYEKHEDPSDIYSIKWERDNGCLLIVFSDDGEADFSFKLPDEFYVTITTFDVFNPPPELLATIKKMELKND